MLWVKLRVGVLAKSFDDAYWRAQRGCTARAVTVTGQGVLQWRAPRVAYGRLAAFGVNIPQSTLFFLPLLDSPALPQLPNALPK